MFIISDSKGTGKTKVLIEKVKAAGKDGILVCADPDSMRERAYSYGITGLTIWSYKDLYRSKLDDCDKQIYIHDISKFIKHSFYGVAGYSVNID